MKFIDSFTTPSDGYSRVIVKHRGSYYSGDARRHPDDEWNEFTGCRYAEERAEIAALYDEWQEKKAKCEECRKFVVAVQQYANFNADDPSAKAMFRQLNRRIKEVNDLAEEISTRKFNLKIAIAQQDEFKKKLDKRNSRKD